MYRSIKAPLTPSHPPSRFPFPSHAVNTQAELSREAPREMEKLRSSICFCCCFRSSEAVVVVDPLDNVVVDGRRARNPSSLLRSSCSWLRSKAPSELLPDRCRGLISRLGCHQRRHCAPDFRYDPLSYSLNFDDSGCGDNDDDGGINPMERRYRNFSSRLPASPPPPAAGEVACS